MNPRGEGSPVTADRVRQVRPLTRKELRWLKTRRIRQLLDDITQELEGLAQISRQSGQATSSTADRISRCLIE